MKKTLIFSLLSLFTAGQIYAAAPSLQGVTQNNVIAVYNVHITLVHSDGSPVTGPVGLQGFWARNEQTGVYYYTDREAYDFIGLPAGTYTFGAYPGPWEGAVSQTAVVNSDREVALHYWVE